MTKIKKNKEETRKERRAGAKVIRRIIKDTRPIAPKLLLASLVSLVSVLLAMAAPELVGRLTNNIYEIAAGDAVFDKNTVLKLCITLAAVYLLSAVASAVTMIIMNNTVTRHFTCRIRTEMSAKIASIPVKVADSTPNGEIISRMTNDVSVMGGTVHNIFDIIINGVIKLVVITVVIFVSNPLMALTVVVFVPISIVISARLSARSEKYFNESRKVAGKIYSLTEEDLTGFETVKAFNLEAEKQREYEKISAEYREKSAKAYRTSGIVQPIVAFVNSIAYIAICVIGGILTVNGRLDVGTLVSFVLYTQLYAGPLESISSGMSMMQSTVASAGRVYEFLDGEEMKDNRRLDAPVECVGSVRFENVSFSYTADKPLIEDLNLDIKAGQKVAIVGPTGGGKTTIVNLLMRFYDPTSGRILIDGKDTVKMCRDDVRDMFAMVLQDTVLFSGTVYDNIAYGKEGATREEVIEAAKRAHIDLFIDSLKDGYDTVINEESTNISGGQKQLLTIARAYLSNRPMLILDEATSNVDTRTELIIQRTMDELMKNKTSFVIAHRLSTIENADIILVIDKGHVVECGTHKELIESGGLYSEIHASQYAKVQ